MITTGLFCYKTLPFPLLPYPFPFHREIAAPLSTHCSYHTPFSTSNSSSSRRRRSQHNSIRSFGNISCVTNNAGVANVEEKQAEAEVAKGYTMTQFCDKMIEFFLHEKPNTKDWRKILVFREEWGKYKESFYARCRARVDTEEDQTMKQKLIVLARKVKKIDDEVEKHADLLTEIRNNPLDFNAVVARRRKDFTGEFFRHLNILSDTHDSLEDRDAMSRLGAKCLSAVRAYDNAMEQLETLDVAQSKFDDILDSSSLDGACEKIKSLAKAKELDSCLILLISRAWIAAKESTTMKNEVRKNLYWTPCAAHCIDLMLKDIANDPHIKPLIRKSQDMTCFIYNHGWALSIMRTETQNGELVRPAITRFATNFIAFDSILKHQADLKRMINTRGWTDNYMRLNRKDREKTYVVVSLIESQTYWRDIAGVTAIFRPLVKVLRMVDSDDKAEMGHLYEAMDMAKEMIKKNVGQGYRKWWEMIDTRWNSQLHRDIHAAGYFLNPKYQYSNDVINDDEVLNGFHRVVNRMVNDNTTRLNINKEVKDIMYHIYRTANKSLKTIAPPEIKLLKHLLNIMDPEERFSALATAFSPGDDHAIRDVDALYTTPKELHKWITIMLDTYHLNKEESDLMEARQMSDPMVIQRLIILKEIIKQEYMNENKEKEDQETK